MRQSVQASGWSALVLCLILGDGWALAQLQEPAVVPVEDYVLYDRVVTSKFLTNETRLVFIERLTVSRLYPDQEVPTTISLFDEHDLFDRRLPPDLVREFVFKNRQPARLGAQFNFGVRYRFVAPEGTEEPEVSLAIPATWPKSGSKNSAWSWMFERASRGSASPSKRCSRSRRRSFARPRSSSWMSRPLRSRGRTLTASSR